MSPIASFTGSCVARSLPTSRVSLLLLDTLATVALSPRRAVFRLGDLCQEKLRAHKAVLFAASKYSSITYTLVGWGPVVGSGVVCSVIDASYIGPCVLPAFPFSMSRVSVRYSGYRCIARSLSFVARLYRC